MTKSRAKLVVLMQSSGQDKSSIKHRSSFFQHSKAAKVVAAILFGGESYLVTLPRY
uniref:Uncharacterized protein n=1 Tax=Amphimedon queenslandica TaxID=400682 RepID=A0A1X7SDH6_AMPQE